ncbi:MAG: putative O-methyltransferase [Alphaproteobacteria bacterium MarineAlpha10_Bin3]|nr:MAG: putative O-methyltransferase [Alphaproteobacteria bacterium MarineAlpha10_Bin3]PPR70863.1 MAG: putative O-methyltransferase [Alphaproteobacteria bacterium MarineAlpha4_Bin1]
MSNRTIPMTDALYGYYLNASLREPDILARLRAKTAERSEGDMQISPEQGQFMAFLIRLTGARRAIEIGTYTGYSALCVALAMPKGSRMVTCDRRPEWPRVGQPFWREAGVDDIIDLRIGKALDTLDAMIAAGESGSYDFAFIDGDKKNYVNYYEQCLILLRPGGVIAIDNMLWSGRLVNDALDDPASNAIRALNIRIRDDSRVDSSLLPIGDGLALVRKLDI